MTRLGLILLAALATSTRAAWRLDSKMTRPTKLLLATLAAAAATPWPRLEDVDKDTKAIRQRALRSTRQHGLEVGVRRGPQELRAEQVLEARDQITHLGHWVHKLRK